MHFHPLLKSTGNFIESTYFNQSSSNINQQVALFQWLKFGDGEIYWEKHLISFSGCGLYLLIAKACVFSEMPLAQTDYLGTGGKPVFQGA